MPVPNFQSFMLPVLRASSGGEVRVASIFDQVADDLRLSAEDRAERLRSGLETILSNRAHWAKTYLGKAGLVESTRRGFFRITQRGLELLASQPENIDTAYLLRYPEFRDFLRPPRTDELGGPAPDAPLPEVETETPDTVMRSAYGRIESALVQDVLERVRTASPAFFERLIVVLLLKMGYGGSADDAGRTLGRSGDDGVDGVIDQDALGLDRVYVQAKRYAFGNNIGPGAIRDFFGSLDRHKAAKGLFVTTSNFSVSARETAEYLSKRIVLIDGDQLAKLMIRYDVGCRVVEVLQIRRIDGDFFE